MNKTNLHCSYFPKSNENCGINLTLTFNGGDSYTTHIGNHRINSLLKVLVNPNKSMYKGQMILGFKSNYIVRLILLKYIKDNRSRFTKSLGDFIHDNDI